MNLLRRTLLVACLAASCLRPGEVEGEVYPKPLPEKAFAELKILSSEGSPWRQPVEDWEGARQRIESDPAWKSWLKEKRQQVDHWLEHRRDKAEWIAGWWHDFVSPKDGSFLTWTAEEPGEETLSSPSDPKVKLTPKIHGGWVYVFRTRHAGIMEEAAMLYRLTGERRYGEWAAGQIDFYATNYLRWPLQTSKGRSRIMHQSLDEAVNLTRYANTARILGDFVAADQKDRWFHQLFKPEAGLLEETFQFVHNIACWQRSAVGQVAMLYGDEDLWRKAVDGKFGIRRQLAEGVTSDYLWFEQSLGYNGYVVSALLPFFEYAALTGHAREVRQEMAVLENLMLSPIMMRFPTGQLPNPADSTGGPGRAPNRGMLAAAYRLYPTLIGLAEAAQARNWDTLLDPPQRINGETEGTASLSLPEVPSWNLESSRMAILKGGKWQVYFHYGQVHPSHAQAEALNFEAFYGDTDITHDPGTVGYGSPLHRGYYTQGPCHNVPLVNGLGQAGWNPGELLAFEPENGRVAARQRQYRKGFLAERELRIQGERLMDAVRIEATSETNGLQKLGLTLHLQGKAQLPESFQPDAGFAQNRPAPFGYWKEVRIALFRDSATFKVNCDRQPLRMTFEVPGKFRLWHGISPDTPPKQREVFYVETEGQKAVFRTILEPVR